MLERATAKRKLEKIVIHKEKFKRIDAESSQVQLAELAEILKTEGLSFFLLFFFSCSPSSHSLSISFPL